MSLIFVSHSSKDNATAEELRERLAEQGHRSVFLDFDPEDGIPAGRDWEQELYRSIRGCRAVIVLCSRHSMVSRWCFMEITHARALGKPLFPVKIDACDLDGVLADRQVIDLTAEPEVAFQRLWRGLLASGLDPADAFDWDGSRPPYPGLLAFQEEDAAVFFGREAEIAEGLDLLNKVRHFGQAGMVMVFGASGTGKSSLVRAGLLPRLRRDVERWLVVDPFRPRDDPARELAGVLARAFERVGRKLQWQSIYERIVQALQTGSAAAEPETPRTDERASGGADERRFLEQLSRLEASVPDGAGTGVSRYLRLLRAAAENPASEGRVSTGRVSPSGTNGDFLVEMASDLRIRSGRADAKILLVVDQFEELLGQYEGSASDGFLRFLRASLEVTGSPVLVLGTMRSDFLGAFQRSPALLGQRYESLSLAPMSPEGVAQIIQKPAEVASIDLEPGLVQALVDDAETEDSLPLLAFTLRELNERFGDDKLLKVEEYREKLGGLQGAVAKPAEELLSAERIGEHHEALLRKAFLDMARVSDDGHFTRRARRWDDFTSEIHPLLERFVQARLLVSGGSGGERTLEVAHEALFRSWDRLRAWLEQSSEVLRLRHEIQYGARTWHQSGRIDEDLWRGGRLARARELIQSGDLLLEDLDRDFVEASHRLERANIETEEKRRKRELRRTQIFAGVVGVAFVVAAGLGIYAVLKRADALESQKRAEGEAAKAEVSATQAGINEAEALKQGRLATERQLDAEAARELADIERLRAEAEEREARAQQRAAQRALARASVEVAVRLIEDGRDQQGLAYLAAALRLRPESALAACWIAEILRWGSGAIPPGQVRLGSRALTAEFSSDGLRVLALEEGSTFAAGGIRVWDAATGVERDGLGPGSPRLPSSLSRDGRRALTIRPDHGVQVHDAVTGDPVGKPMAHEAEVHTARFGHDSRWVVTASADGTARLWNSESGDPVLEPLRHDGAVTSASFSPDGRWIVTASADGTARVWSTETGKPAIEPLRHDGPVTSASASPDGTRVATTDGTVRIWSIPNGAQLEMQLEHEQAVSSVEFSPDGLRLLTVGYRQAQVWDLTTRRMLGRPWGHDGQLTSARFAGDGRRVVTTWGADVWLSEGTKGGAQIRDAASGQPIGVSLRHRESVLSARFNSGGQQVVTTSSDGAARIWDVGSGDPVGEPLQHDGPVESARFSPDGRIVLTLSGEGRRATLWDVATGDPKVVLPVRWAQLMADGRTVVTASESTVQVWDSRTGQPMGEPIFKGATINGAQFSNDGRRVAIESDFKVHIRDTASGDPIGKPLRGRGDEIYLQFSPDGSRLVTSWTAIGGALGVAPEGRAQVWSTATGEALGEELQLPGKVNWAEFSPNGRRLVTAWGSSPSLFGGVDRGGAQVWDAETGAAVGEPLLHNYKVHTAQFSPDGRRVVTAWGTPTQKGLLTSEVQSAGRGGAQIWDVETGAAIGQPLRHEDDVHSAWFSGDSRLVVTASHDGTAKIWDVAVPSPEESEPLAHLAEVIGGYVLGELGTPVLTELRTERLESLREGASQSRGDESIVPLMTRWLFADRRTRGISPLSRLSYPEYLQKLFAQDAATP